MARKHDVRIDRVPDPNVEDPGDILLRVSATAICDSDLHLLDGHVPAMKSGDILGHEFMGVVVETGSAVTKHKIGDRVVVPFVIACGNCFCERQLFSCCDTTNPDAEANANGGYGRCLGCRPRRADDAAGTSERGSVPSRKDGCIKVFMTPQQTKVE